MLSPAIFRLSKSPRRGLAFSLIELLVVMGIIAILVGLTLAATRGIFAQAGRKRAATEIQAFGTALDGYKVDNGTYPLSSSLATPYTGGSGASYQPSSMILFVALSGQTNYLTPNPTPNTKVYLPNLKPNQVGAPTGPSYLQDPFQNSYGYSTGTAASSPYSGAGFYDVWSTGGTNFASTNTWISNW